MNQTLNVLILDPDRIADRGLGAFLEESFGMVRSFGEVTFDLFTRRLAERPFHLAMISYETDTTESLRILLYLRHRFPGLKVIFVLAEADGFTAADSIIVRAADGCVSATRYAGQLAIIRESLSLSEVTAFRRGKAALAGMNHRTALWYMANQLRRLPEIKAGRDFNAMIKASGFISALSAAPASRHISYPPDNQHKEAIEQKGRAAKARRR